MMVLCKFTRTTDFLYLYVVMVYWGQCKQSFLEKWYVRWIHINRCFMRGRNGSNMRLMYHASFLGAAVIDTSHGGSLNLIRLYMFYTREKKKWQSTFISFMQAICKQSSWYVVVLYWVISLTFPCVARVKLPASMKSTEPLPYFFCVSFWKA